MKINVNNQELEFNYKYSQLKKLCKESGKDLTQLEDLAKDFNNTSLILSVGANISVEEAEEMLDTDGTFETCVNIIKAFSEEVVNYLNPNSQSQTN